MINRGSIEGAKQALLKRGVKWGFLAFCSGVYLGEVKVLFCASKLMSVFYLVIRCFHMASFPLRLVLTSVVTLR